MTMFSPILPDAPFVYHEVKEGTVGKVAVDIEGYDWYGYDENGKDRAGNTEQYYLLHRSSDMLYNAVT